MGDKIELTFAEKHPKLNYMLGLLLLIAIIVVGLFVIKYVLLLLSIVVERVIEESNNVDAVIVVALITGAVSITCMVFGKIMEYRQMRKKYLTEKREAPYRAFVEMVYKIQKKEKENKEYTQEEMIEDITSFSKELTLWGSRKVINKWIEFRLSTAKDDYDPMKNLFVLEEIMNIMRKDLGVGKAHKGRLLAFFVNDIDKYV